MSESDTRTYGNQKSTDMVLLFLSVLLQIIIVNGGTVDLTLQSDNFTGLINFTSDSYTGFFSKLVESQLPVCQFSYAFGGSNLNVPSTTCSSLNITDYGESFECGEVNSTIFECNRMEKNSSCENNTSWFVFYNSNDKVIKRCVGIYLTGINETVSVRYQENITTVPEYACPRPGCTTNAALPTAAYTISETQTSTIVVVATSHMTTRSTQPILDNSTIYINDESNKNIKDFIPLIAGICTGGGVLIIVIFVVIVACVKRRTTKKSNNPHRTTESDHYVGDTRIVYDISDEKIRDNSIHNGREPSKISGIEFDVMGDFKAAGNDSTQTNHKNVSLNKPIYLETDQVDQVHSDVNNKNNPAYSFIAYDKDTGDFEVSVPKLDNQPNDKTSTTSFLHSNEIDTGYELVGWSDKPLRNIYARLGESVREFENPYNETLNSDFNLKETDSEHGNVETNLRHDMLHNLDISPGPDNVIAIEGLSDVYAQVI
ncbi:unnamed protein product [Lymnaea stagnalis]|uniref:Uncharacterized protein n=1 Tax=Lymnaea stagnalis TaxID=6523 RepID=A0AAV2H8I7_LYMST